MSQHEKENFDFDALSPDETGLSEISFPSHVSGLESFADLEETVGDDVDDQVFQMENSKNRYGYDTINNKCDNQYPKYNMQFCLMLLCNGAF